ncbi:TetR/AcrR family transcriptional regulator [Streptomyces sp. A7024]|uniref:TetR/AcrR family transcriptional regulator n=1 Tax=Streptomyces coryli TaxID=1128680 RepID=A0A6G4U7W9_9ACTN|nr:TetR/AcrR family transcriptional regulator [Streptomyces coryli]NGN68335.1 TetR/AcrR family transcriptional regulator [Streptomyces coryli]
MGTSHRTAPGAQPATHAARRRGSVLEQAILDAALDQLGAVGWKGLTIEGVAARAHTGKAAVYRRWPSKLELVAESLKSGIPPLIDPPDSGDLRADLVSLCGWMREQMYSRSGLALRALMDECDRTEGEYFAEVILGRVVDPVKELIAAVVRRGIDRGEVRPDATCKLVADVVPAMMMYLHKTSGCDVQHKDLVQVIDQIMMPLLRADAPGDRVPSSADGGVR